MELDKLQSKSVKNGGVIYTPEAIVSYMVELLSPKPDQTIIEPSCGHGAFLFGLLKHMRTRHNLSGSPLVQWMTTKVTATDISERAIRELKETLCLYFEKHDGIKLSPETFEQIFVQDSLFHPAWKLDSFDLCIGNPPYVRTKNIDIEYLLQLRKTFSSCVKGNIDLYYAFIEQFANLSKKACFITPNGFLSNASGKVLRKLVESNVDTLIDFKAKLIFQDARTYTCITLLSKEGVTNSLKEKVFYANDIGHPLKLIHKSTIFPDKKVSTELIPVPKVLSGTATLCDDVFTVSYRNGNYFAKSFGEEFPIEKEILVPYLKLTKVKQENLILTDYMIYPYHEDKSPILEDEMASRYPLAYRYLLFRKERLLERDRGKTDKYEAWYAYGRKQGLHSGYTPLIYVVPQMIGGTCIPRKIDISSLLKTFKTLVFTSGYVVLNTEFGESLLTENFLDYAKQNGKAWPGKEAPYYALNVKQIRAYQPEIA